MRIKKVHVVPAWRNSRYSPLNFFLSIFLLTVLSYSELKATTAYQHQPLIASKGSPNPANCQLLSTGPGVDLKKQNSGLHDLLSDLTAQFKRYDFSGFYKFFHKRAKVKKSIGDKLSAIISHRYQKPWEFSVFRVWELKHKDKAKHIYDCPEADHSSIISRYGYDTQYAVWMQLMGQNELGRLLLSIAPNKQNQLVIIGFHIQQWTQSGHDWEYWTKEGNRRLEAKQPLHAYFAYDVAHKLLEGGDFVAYKIKSDILETQQKIFSQKDLVSKLQTLVPMQSIAYVATALNRDGVGLFVRLRVAEVKSTNALQKECMDLGTALIKASWLSPEYSGLRCNFLLPHEKVEQNGKLGGFYYTRSELNKQPTSAKNETK